VHLRLSFFDVSLVFMATWLTYMPADILVYPACVTFMSVVAHMISQLFHFGEFMHETCLPFHVFK